MCGPRKLRMKKVEEGLCWLTNRSTEYKPETNIRLELVWIISVTVILMYVVCEHLVDLNEM